MWQKIKNFLGDLLFPVECLICGKEKTFFCNSCQRQIKLLDNKCLICNANNSSTGICQSCKLKTSLDELHVIAHYKGTVLEKIIHEFKFNFVEELAEILAGLLVENVKVQDSLSEYAVIAIPLHNKRYLQRGFNQSFLLAKIFAQKKNLQLFDKILIRKKVTHQQAKLSRQQRFENLKNAFVVLDNDYLKEKKIILIDDVVTSAATLNEAAKTLKQAGVKKVIGVAVAHE